MHTLKCAQTVVGQCFAGNGPNGLSYYYDVYKSTDLLHPRVSGIISADWKSANVTAIHKKGNRLESGNYRPISLASEVCKKQ